MFDYEFWNFSEFEAPVQMAIEEYLLHRAAETKKAQIRFWSFPRDTIVLGYAQNPDAVKSFTNVVRRSTGGSHVQTGKNIFSYTIATPHDGSFRNFEDMRKYYAQKIATALSNLGLSNVQSDNRASSVNVNDRVMAAHAMIWGVHSGLFHGLLLLDSYDLERLNARINLGARKIGNKTYFDLDLIRNTPTISKLLPDLARFAPNRQDAQKLLLSQTILNTITKTPEHRQITPEILKRAAPLYEKRYNHPLWTQTHNPTFSTEEIDTIPGEQLNGPLKQEHNYCMFLQLKDQDFKRMALPPEE